MKAFSFAVPGDLATPTGGYAYDRRIIAELTALGWSIDVINLGEGFPRPDAHTLAGAEVRLAALPAHRPVVIDGLALGAMPEAAAKVRLRNPLVALVHHPLALESGLSARDTAKFRDSERAALSHAARVIVTSAATAAILSADYDVPADRITVARPGNDPADPARGSTDGTVRLLAVGSFVPRKGYDILVEALKQLADLPWRLTIAGDVERDAATAAKIRGDIAHSGLAERIVIAGPVTTQHLTALYAESDLFVLASRYEGYGMAYAEAIAHGLPVVGTTAGAIPEAVPAEASMLLPPGDARAIADALRTLLVDTEMRRKFAEAARTAASRLPRWRDSALLFAGAIEAAT